MPRRPPIAQGSLQSARKHPRELVANPRNPRHHDQDQIERLRASLKRFGQTKPILVRRRNLMIVAGHGVAEAARQEGIDELAVELWDVDQATADAYMLADNRHGDLSEPDEDQVALLLRDIDPGDYLAVGYTDDEAAELAGVADDDEAATVVDIPTDPVDDRFWISVQGPLTRQADVLDRLKTVLAEYPEVSVELGTVSID